MVNLVIRDRVRLSLILSCLAAWAFAGRVAAADRPNLVVLVSDDQTTYSLGCYGNADVRTPHLDRLAEEGMVFDRHYDTTAICMASRASLMTGLFEYRTGCNFGHGPLVRERWQASYPVLLRGAGYVTAFAGKLGFEVAEAPDRPGRLPEGDFDRWGGGPGQTSYRTAENLSMAAYAEAYPHSTRSYGAFGRDFIRGVANGDRPFCLSVSFKAPHKPDEPDPAFDEVYAGAVFAKPGNYGREFGQHFAPQSRQGRQYERFESWGYADRYDEAMAVYHQLVYGIDVAVGMIREALDEAGVADNTVILFTSDNGFLCGSHGYGSKVLPYEEASRAPLILLDPRHANSGRRLRCTALTGNVDVAPTVLNLAGVPLPPDLDGRSLTALYDDPDDAIHDVLPLVNVWGPRAVHSLGVVSKAWKYVYWPYDEGDFEPAEELYDLVGDPLELSNLAADPAHRDTLRRLRTSYDRTVWDWNRRAVPYHNYARFGALFDRGRTDAENRAAQP